jgi:hypothetical protein
MAGQEGFEPPTPGFGVRRSSHSSYWPAGLVFSITGFVPSGIKEYWKVGILGTKEVKTAKNIFFPLFTPTISLIHNSICCAEMGKTSDTEPTRLHSPNPPNCAHSLQFEQARSPPVAKILGLFALTVQGMMSTVAAIFPELQFFWSSPLILCCSVVSSFTL